jgi:hypothetical protein
MTHAPPPPDPAASDGAPLPVRTSDLLIHLATASEAPEMTVGELLDALKDRAFGVAMLVLALPVCIPFLYGVPQVLSLPMLLIALQMVAGRHTLWMPEKLRARRFSRAEFAKMARRAKRYLGWGEALARPRFSLLTGNGPERVFGVFMVIFCLSILTPLPLTNTTPGIAVAIVSIGMIERDGLLVLAGTVLGTFWVSMLLFFFGTLILWLEHLQGLIG